MNVRQQLYKKNVILGMSKYNAAIAAGYSEGTARHHIKDLDNRVSMPDVMERQGITDKFISEKLLELLSATKVVGYLHQYKQGSKGVTEKIEPDEVVSNEFVEVPDWGARAKGVELVGKFSGKLRDKVDLSASFTYTEMRRIIIDGKPQELNIGEVPDSIKKRLNQ